MTLNPVFQGSVKAGKLILDAPMRYLKHLSHFEGQQIELVVRKHKSIRSNLQNQWYWGVIVELLAQHCGYTPAEMHEALKYRFLSDGIMDMNELVRIKSTTQLSTAEFCQYTDRIVRWAAESLQLYIPDPNQVDYE